jgi:hypothetical protein
MFEFVVKYFGLLKHVPLAAHVMDSCMMLWTYTFSPDIIGVIEKIAEEVSTWRGITCSQHKFGGLQFNYHNKEIGHIHHNGVVDVLFDRKTKQELVRGGKAQNHHTFKASGWISFYIHSATDYHFALELLQTSYKQKKSC